MDYELGGELELLDWKGDPSLQAGELVMSEVSVRIRREYNSDDCNRQRGVAMPEEDVADQMG